MSYRIYKAVQACFNNTMKIQTQEEINPITLPIIYKFPVISSRNGINDLIDIYKGLPCKVTLNIKKFNEEELISNEIWMSPKWGIKDLYQKCFKIMKPLEDNIQETMIEEISLIN